MCFILPISSGNSLHWVITARRPTHVRRLDPRSGCPLTPSITHPVTSPKTGPLPVGSCSWARNETGCLLGEGVGWRATDWRKMQPGPNIHAQLEGLRKCDCIVIWDRDVARRAPGRKVSGCWYPDRRKRS